MNRTGQEFVTKTMFRFLSPSDQSRALPQPRLEEPHPAARTRIPLPHPREIETDPIPLREAMEKRTSLRTYEKAALSLSELAFLLWCTQGVKGAFPPAMTLRTVPSAGARHALETYLAISNVEGLEAGLYQYQALSHELAHLELGAFPGDEISQACLGQDFVRKAAVLFIWTAVPYRMTWRYGERGYRYLYLDVGHVCQNLYLAVEAIQCGACALGAFHDDQLNSLLQLDGENQFVIYLASVGKM